MGFIIHGKNIVHAVCGFTQRLYIYHRPWCEITCLRTPIRRYDFYPAYTNGVRQEWADHVKLRGINHPIQFIVRCADVEVIERIEVIMALWRIHKYGHYNYPKFVFMHRGSPRAYFRIERATSVMLKPVYNDHEEYRRQDGEWVRMY